jgi:mono/diheme cytochrome c family protein
MADILGLATMLVATTSLVWSGVRARRMKNRFVKWGVMGLAAVLIVPVASLAALTIVGTIKQHARSAPVPELEVEATPERIARGKAVVDGFCSACHSPTGTLTGGLDIGEHFPLRVGSFVSANLTPAGRLKGWSDGEIFRAIRNGVDADGRWLTLMSYTNAGSLSDDDTQAVIAYIRSVPAAGEPTPDPPSRLNLLGVLMLGAGMLPSGKPIVTGSITAPPKGPTFAFGEYILSYQDCRECHGRLAEFIATMRTGVDPNGHQMSEQMPWRPLGRMDDDELAAVYEYLIHLRGS